MRKSVYSVVCILVFAATALFAGVSVSAPSNNATVQSPVHFAASATSSCSKGVASMGIYTGSNVLAFTAQGSHLSTNLHLNPGTCHTVIEEWDYCGGATTIPVTITVKNTSAVDVTSPANNSTATSSVHFAANATSSCQQGVASMGVYTAPGQLA